MTGTAFPTDASGGAPQFPSKAIRASLGALMAGRTDRALGAVSGLHPGSDPVVTFSGLNWTVTPFCGTSDPGTGGDVGAYLTAFSVNETGTLAAADGTSTRVDRFDIVVPDDPPTDGVRTAVLKVTSGVPGGGAPAAPARSWPLGQASVPASGSGSAVSWSPAKVYTAAAGGLIPVPDAAHYPAHPYDGQPVYRTDDDTLRIWDGTSWELHSGGDSGILTSGISALSGFSLTTARLLRAGNMATLYVSGTLTTAIAVGTSGDTANTDVAKVTNALFLPRAGLWTQPLVSNASGPLIAAVIAPDGTITITSTATNALPVGQAISLSGPYFL